MPPDLVNLKNEVELAGWKIVDNDAMTRLYRTVSNIKVQISFHCQDTVETNAYEDDNDEDEEEEEEEESSTD